MGWVADPDHPGLFVPTEDWRRGRSAPELTEALVRAPAHPEAPPQGFVDGIPVGGTTRWNAGDGGQMDRREWMAQLYGAYLSCPWSSACVDEIARTITAGGLQLVPTDASDDDLDALPTMPPNVAELQRLLDFVNPREDIRQLLRGIFVDLDVFGDSFTEVVWLLGRPVALYSLDCPSMIPQADEHGTVTGYWQVLDFAHQVDFAPSEVIHISLDAPRGGVYGVGPTQKALTSVTTWLFAAGLLKELMRKGNPPRLHTDYPLETAVSSIKRDRQQYAVQNIGVLNTGNMFTTQGGAHVQELSVNQIAEIVAIKTEARDEILAEYGVPPRKLGIAEPGQLGGAGEGTTQDKTFRVNTCGPKAELVLEKWNYHLVTEAFGITDWELAFGDVDWRDDKVIDDIDCQRLRDGRITLNKGRKNIGEPAVPGGDDPVLVDRQNLVLWSDMSAMSKAVVAKAGGPQGPASAVPGTVPPIPPADGKSESGPAVPIGEDDGANHTGVMVALFPPRGVAKALAVEGGCDPADMHITVAYLGDAAELANPDELATVVEAWALATPALEATISGLGVFNAGPGSASPVTYASVDAPDLPAARQRLVELLGAAGFAVSTEHGFTPHMTLDYADRVAELERPTEAFTFRTVTVAVGDDRQVFALAGGAAESTPVDKRVPAAEATALSEAFRADFAERRRRARAELAST